MKLEDIFSRDIVLWRCVRALGCLLILQLILPMTLCNVYCNVVVQGIINPITIVKDLLMSFVMPSQLLNLFVPAICFLMLGRVHIHSYSVSSWIPTYQWEWWRRFFTLKVQFGIVMMTGACILLAGFYTSLAYPTFPRLFVPCSAGDVVCWPRKVSIICVGLCTGLSYSMKYFLGNGNVVTLTPAHPRRLQLIKSNFNSHKLKEACNSYGASKFSLLCTLCICMVTSALAHLSGGGAWQDLMKIIELPLIVIILLSTILLATTLFLFTEIFQLFLAEPIEIPLTVEEDSNIGSDDDAWRLSNALSSSGLLQLLAFWDLKSLASSDPRNFFRRSQIFAISQPGGHPRNWLGIMNPSLNLIRKFTERLKRHNCPEELPKPPVTALGPTTDVNKNEVTKPPPVPLKERVVKVILGLKGYPVFSYFLTELPDATNRSIFAEALPVIWSVQALGDLVAASFTEDKFGVVQRNIPDILMAFTQLQKMVDSVGRVSVTRRASASDSCQSEQQLRKALKFSLRSSIYTVTTTFGPTLLEMPVSAECSSKLQSYLEFKEA